MLDEPQSSNSPPSKPQLALTAGYYIRKLLHQNLDRLKFVVASGAAMQADPLADLNAVLQSLYLEDSDLKATIKQLERMASYHQALSGRGNQHRLDLENIEQQIFWLLGFKLNIPTQQGIILLVDDQPENLRLLSSTLTKQGYEVRNTVSGVMALTAAKTVKPDLILLDIMMPGTDGYEVCRQLKADEQTQDIPIIFVSAISDAFDKVKAFDVGGVDYITKPFQIEEVIARVANQFKIRNLQQRLAHQNARLQSEMSLHHQERRRLQLMQVAIDRMGDYVLLINASAQVIYANDAACQRLGYELADLKTMTLLDIDSAMDATEWSAHWQKLKSWGFLTWQSQHRSQVGNMRHVSLAGTYCQFEDQEYLCLIVRDITS